MVGGIQVVYRWYGRWYTGGMVGGIQVVYRWYTGGMVGGIQLSVIKQNLKMKLHYVVFHSMQKSPKARPGINALLVSVFYK